MTEPQNPNTLVELRASDADRERVAERLREAATDGRITMDELEERVDATYAAKTHAELKPLTSLDPSFVVSGWLVVSADWVDVPFAAFAPAMSGTGRGVGWGV